MDIKVLFEDEYLLVVDKPSGLVVNRSHTALGDTLQDFLDDKYPIKKDGIKDNPDDSIAYTEDINEEDYELLSKQDFYLRSGIVHRIDKDTSGILIAARNPEVFLSMQKQFKSREVEKVYFALCFGKAVEKFIEIKAPLIRNPKFPFKYAVSPNGKEAVTFLEVKGADNIEGEDVTLYEIKPKTGRTHQIRVHLSAMNQPVIYDSIYNTRKELDWSAQHFPRLMLHAYSVSFKHPITEKQLLIESQLPEEFKAFQ